MAEGAQFPAFTIFSRSSLAIALSVKSIANSISELTLYLPQEQKDKINEILEKYGIKAHVAKYIFGPTVITYLVELESLREDVKSIRKIEDNLAMYLACSNIRILTPIPNMRYAGIEIPKPIDSRSIVYLRDLISSFVRYLHLPH